MTKSRRRQHDRRAAPAVSSRMRWPRAVLVALAVILVVAFALYRVSGGRRAMRPAPGAARPLNLLLITLDTTRPDHLGIYGYERARTRHLDQLAREGVRFEWELWLATNTVLARKTTS
jgi:hypothetical protein